MKLIVFLLFVQSIFGLNDLSYLIVVKTKNNDKNSGGVLLSKSYGLTTCTLLVDLKKSPFISLNPKKFEVKWTNLTLNIDAITLHPKCRRLMTTVFFDYACVRLEKELEWSSFSTLNLLKIEDESAITSKQKCNLYTYNKKLTYIKQTTVVSTPEICRQTFCKKFHKKSPNCLKMITDISNDTSYCLIDKSCGGVYPIFCDNNFWGLAKKKACNDQTRLWQIFDSSALDLLINVENIVPHQETKLDMIKQTENKPKLEDKDAGPNYFVVVMTKYDEDFLTTGIVVSSYFIITNCSPFVTFNQELNISSIMDAESISYRFISNKTHKISKITPHPKCKKMENNFFFDIASLKSKEEISDEKIHKFPHSKLLTFSKHMVSLPELSEKCNVTFYNFKSKTFQLIQGRMTNSEDCLDKICQVHGTECLIPKSGVTYETLCFFTDKCNSIGASPLICQGHLFGISKFTNCDKNDLPILFEQVEHFSEITDLMKENEWNKSNKDDHDYDIGRALNTKTRFIPQSIVLIIVVFK